MREFDSPTRLLEDKSSFNLQIGEHSRRDRPALKFWCYDFIGSLLRSAANLSTQNLKCWSEKEGRQKQIFNGQFGCLIASAEICVATSVPMGFREP